MVSKEKVIEEVGNEVFEWGLLIGDEDADRLTDETKHILVTFAHQSIQEFFGAFYFILSLSEGEEIVSLLGGDCKNPVFLMNPLFLEFCLWLMHATELTSFLWEGEVLRELLITYLVRKIDNVDLDLKDRCIFLPALHISDLKHDRNPMALGLMKDVLSQCSKMEWLSIDTYSLPVDELLSAVNPGAQIHTLQLFMNSKRHYVKCQQPEGELHILLYYLPNPLEMLRVALKYCYRAQRRPCIDIDMAGDSHLELSELLQIKDIRQLHVGCRMKHVSCNQDIPYCPSLRQLSLEHLRDGDDVLSALRNAIQRGHLPNLKYLNFYGSSFKTEGILPYLFGSRTPALEHLDLSYVRLNKMDLEFINELRNLRVLCLSTGPFVQKETVKFLFQNPDANVWATLSVLRVFLIDSRLKFLERFVRVVNENKLPNLKELSLSFVKDNLAIFLLKLQAEKLPSLKRLSLKGFIYSGEDVHNLVQKLVKWDLEDLCIFGGMGISGHLSVLFSHCLPSLTDLRLCCCELNSDDMRCLIEARMQGRLPKLKHVDVAHNRIADPKMWNKNEAWKNVYVNY